MRRERAAGRKHRHPQRGRLLAGLRRRVGAATRDHKRQARKHIRQQANPISASHQLRHLPPWSMSSNVMPVAAVPTRKSVPSRRDRNNRAVPRSRDSARVPRRPSNPPRGSHRRAGRCSALASPSDGVGAVRDEVALRAEVGQAGRRAKYPGSSRGKTGSPPPRRTTSKIASRAFLASATSGSSGRSQASVIGGNSSSTRSQPLGLSAAIIRFSAVRRSGTNVRTALAWTTSKAARATDRCRCRDDAARRWRAAIPTSSRC